MKAKNLRPVPPVTPLPEFEITRKRLEAAMSGTLTARKECEALVQTEADAKARLQDLESRTKHDDEMGIAAIVETETRLRLIGKAEERADAAMFAAEEALRQAIADTGRILGQVVRQRYHRECERIAQVLRPWCDTDGDAMRHACDLHGLDRLRAEANALERTRITGSGESLLNTAKSWLDRLHAAVESEAP